MLAEGHVCGRELGAGYELPYHVCAHVSCVRQAMHVAVNGAWHALIVQ